MYAGIYATLGAISALLTCLAACATKALREFSRADLEDVCQRQDQERRLSEILRMHEPTALACESLQALATALTFWSAFQWGRLNTSLTLSWQFLAVELLTASLVIVVAVSWLPWTFVRIGSEGFLCRFWPLLGAIRQLLYPLTLVARALDWAVFRSFGREPKKLSDESFEEEILAVVTEGHREGHIAETERDMIEGVIELSDVKVSEVMTPRTDMICLPDDASLDEALAFVISHAHTRIPVYHDTRDTIVGILHARDLLEAAGRNLPCPPEGRNGQATQLKALLQEPQFVPESKKVIDLLNEFRQNRKHLAIVLDEFGGVAGLVTIEDILEEIVGEIADEYDQAQDEGIRRLDEHSVEALGRVHIDELNDALQLDLPDEADFDTIGGFVFSTLGHVPLVGEQLTHGNVRITVLDATRRRIERVKLEVLDRDEPTEAA